MVDQLAAETIKTKAAVEMLKRLGVTGKGLLVDVKLDEKLALAVRNIDGVRSVESGRLTARDLAGGGRDRRDPRGPRAAAGSAGVGEP